MYKKEFDKLEKIPNYFLFFGNLFYLKIYEEKLLEKFKNENIVKFYFDDYDFDEIKSYLTQSSLFGEKNIIFIKHNKIPPKIEKLKSFAKENYLFFFYYNDKNPNIFDKNFVRFFAPSFKELIEYITSLEKKYNLNISLEAKKFLANSIEASFLDEEIKKLSLYDSSIDLNSVKELTFIYKEESFEELFIEILNSKDFFHKLNQLLVIVDYKRIIPALIRYIRELLEYKLYIKSTAATSLEGYLGYKLPIDIEKERINLALKFKEKELKELLIKLMKFELKIRSTQKDKEAIFWEAMSFLKNFNTF